MVVVVRFLSPANEVWDKVMFSQVSVCPPGGVHGERDACNEGGIKGEGHAWKKGCMWRRGERGWLERRPLQWAVRIQLEYILVYHYGKSVIRIFC